jgi:hypothetical protein
MEYDKGTLAKNWLEGCNGIDHKQMTENLFALHPSVRSLVLKELSVDQLHGIMYHMGFIYFGFLAGITSEMPLSHTQFTSNQSNSFDRLLLLVRDADLYIRKVSGKTYLNLRVYLKTTINGVCYNTVDYVLDDLMFAFNEYHADEWMHKPPWMNIDTGITLDWESCLRADNFEVLYERKR